PHHMEITIAIASNSNYLTDIVVRNPEFLYQIFNPEYLTQELSLDKLNDKIQIGLSNYKTYEAKLNYLRLFKRRIILSIGVNDILKKSNILETTLNLSILANSIISSLFQICYEEVKSKHKLPSLNAQFCLVSLGKLGGNELNYSSDIDLMVFYENDPEVSRETSNEFYDLLNNTILLFIKSSTVISDKGYIYRVDFRLRPDGSKSPLCRTFTDLTAYYETRGEEWERQMLIKLNYVSGSRILYKKFTSFLKKHVYESRLNSSPLDKIKQMKKNIELYNRSEENIKFSKGGIRDIEFSVQALQLINGNKFEILQNSNTLATISCLGHNNLLSVDEAETLTEAYVFYRKIEHFMQLMNDTQTHKIPSDEILLNKLAIYQNQKNISTLNIQVSQYRKDVQKIYSSVFNADKGNENQKGEFDSIKFADRKRAEKNLNYLRTGKGLLEQKQFDTRTIKNFDRIANNLIHYLNTSEAPDLTLENLVKVTQGFSLPSIIYREFEDKNFLNSFLKICNFSQIAIDSLSIIPL
ncbi:hypothetical protein ACFLS9_10950, partial [Bacteroidota bacterium]